jgi:hypothetical protein
MKLGLSLKVFYNKSTEENIWIPEQSGRKEEKINSFIICTLPQILPDSTN